MPIACLETHLYDVLVANLCSCEAPESSLPLGLIENSVANVAKDEHGVSDYASLAPLGAYDGSLMMLVKRFRYNVCLPHFMAVVIGIRQGKENMLSQPEYTGTISS